MLSVISLLHAGVYEGARLYGFSPTSTELAERNLTALSQHHGPMWRLRPIECYKRALFKRRLAPPAFRRDYFVEAARSPGLPAVLAYPDEVTAGRSINDLPDDSLSTDFRYRVEGDCTILSQLNIKHSQVRTFVLLNFVFTTLQAKLDAEASGEGALLSTNLPF